MVLSDDKNVPRLYNAHMSLETVGFYLKTLRELHGYTQEEVAGAIGVSRKQVERWEAGKHDPALSKFLVLVEFVQGDLLEATELLRSQAITKEEAKVRADTRFRRTQAENIIGVMNAHSGIKSGDNTTLQWSDLTPEEQAKIDKIIKETSPDKLNQILDDLRTGLQAERERLEQEEKDRLLDAIGGITRLFRQRGER